MKKMDKKVADAYFKARTLNIAIYLAIGFVVSYLVVFNAETFTNMTINGMPAHYFMGAQGAIVTFIILLFVNAIVSDAIDRKYGIDDAQNKKISGSKVVDH
jgi:putative solute:sodium symporter small subunit